MAPHSGDRTKINVYPTKLTAVAVNATHLPCEWQLMCVKLVTFYNEQLANDEKEEGEDGDGKNAEY